MPKPSLTDEEIDELAAEQTELSQSLVQQIAAIFANNKPQIIEAALGDLLAMHLCGYPDFARDEVMERILDLAESLVDVNEKILFNGGRHPQSTGNDTIQ